MSWQDCGWFLTRIRIYTESGLRQGPGRNSWRVVHTGPGHLRPAKTHHDLVTGPAPHRVWLIRKESRLYEKTDSFRLEIAIIEKRCKFTQSLLRICVDKWYQTVSKAVSRWKTFVMWRCEIKSSITLNGPGSSTRRLDSDSDMKVIKNGLPPSLLGRREHLSSSGGMSSSSIRHSMTFSLQ